MSTGQVVAFLRILNSVGRHKITSSHNAVYGHRASRSHFAGDEIVRVSRYSAFNASSGSTFVARVAGI
jgi:hypothetical protein